ncbi:Hypothetical protein CINCED_3A015918 [Cinara cedri]|uniref:Uncharacterized protein n=1 Tax=Cinara cedri TaxID=506608 RepID=A0A5E4NID6_9HEMI|nr:Hypothetical protein CINCED_3A015918 [Cinara cedri]
MSNVHFKNSSTCQDENNEKIAEKHITSMTNDSKPVETEEKPKTSRFVSQSSTNVSINVAAKNISACTTEETKCKDGCDYDAMDTQGSKEPEALKRSLVEKEEEIKSEKPKNEVSIPKQGTDGEKCEGSGTFCSDNSPGDVPKLNVLEIVLRPKYANTAKNEVSSPKQGTDGEKCEAKNEVSSPKQGTDGEKCEGSGTFCSDNSPGDVPKINVLEIVLRPKYANTGTRTQHKK